MKKLLSLILAVMMLLSVAGFAAPYQHGKQNDDYASPAILATTPTARRAHGTAQEPQGDIHEHREYAHENDAHHHQARIAVLDVRELFILFSETDSVSKTANVATQATFICV